MTKLNLYCLSLFDNDYNKIKSLGYKTVGLGQGKFNKKTVEQFGKQWQPYSTIACWYLWQSLNNF